MQTTSGYRIVEQLYQSSSTLAYRAIRQSDEQPVILKIIRESYPSPERIAMFKREYELIRSLNLSGVPRVYALETLSSDRLIEAMHTAPQAVTTATVGGGSTRTSGGHSLSPVLWMMVMEDTGGDSLHRLGWCGTLSLDHFLLLSISIVEVLGHIHQQHIMHKDMNPSNIICAPATGEVKIIDFGIATVLSREHQAFRNPGVLEGTLAYMSPEQTGRMNRAIDYRTDFYSLGVTLYELLTGAVPFVSSDALELVHSHIARHPQPPHLHTPHLPASLSAVIVKLMAKNAEDRYQSAYGIRADLQLIHEWWVGNEPDESLPYNILNDSFVPGQFDVPDRFQIPQKLYGREDEVSVLLTAFEDVSAGGRQLLLVTGQAGIGKTALVQEVHKPITRQQGYFIAGKFDQFQRDRPYSAFIQAFRSLVRHVLTESDIEIADWCRQLHQALGINGQVLLDVIPELERVVGAQPVIASLLPTEAQNRFALVFQKFIRVFSQPQHPLVIFLDDLQWADGASLRLMELLMTAPDSQYLFVIGTFRENEVDASHPLQLTLDRLRASDILPRRIHLPPLDIAAVAQLVTETLHCQYANAATLAELLITKTGGNPYFLNAFLTTLYVDRLFTFDYGAGQWVWDLDHIQAQEMTGNVVELLTRKVQRLPPETQETLKLAACIGSRFDLAKLAVVSQKTVQMVRATLEPSIIAGLVEPIGNAYKVVGIDIPELVDALNAEYAFAHDRIQQTIYAMIPTQERQLVHWRIGHLLLLDAPGSALENSLFDIVNHLNEGRAVAETQSEREELAALNMRAGMRAKAAAAFQPDTSYFAIGIALLEGEDGTNAPQAWQDYYPTMIQLYAEATETAYVNSNFADVARLSAVGLAQAQTLLDKVSFYEVQIQACLAQNLLSEAIQQALMVLDLLGIPFPPAPDGADVTRALEAVEKALNNRPIATLAELPAMTDPDYLAAMRILSQVTTAAYGTSSLFALLVLKQIVLSLRHGNAAESAFAYAAYSILLCGQLGDIERGYAMGQLALHVLERFDARAMAARTLMAFNFTIRHWKEPFRAFLPAFLSAYQIGLETGDPTHACYSLYHHCYMQYMVGANLEVLHDEVAGHTETMAQLKQEVCVLWNRILQQNIINLLGKTTSVHHMEGPLFDEQTEFDRLVALGDMTNLFAFAFHRLILSYLVGDIPEALACMQITEEYRFGAVSLPYIPIWTMYCSLTLLARLVPETDNEPETDTQQRADYLERVAANQQQLWEWSQHAPENVLHRYHLVEAERARILGTPGDAREHYDTAIALSQEQAFVNDEALACHLAGRFYLARGQTQHGAFYLQSAHYAYRRWGATALVHQLETHYPWCIGRPGHSIASRPGEEYGTMVATYPRTGGTSSSLQTTSALDVGSFIKASQAISDELVLDSVLSKLMHIVLENAGGEHGILALLEQGAWVVAAEGHLDNVRITVAEAYPVEHADIPLAIVNYVAHTQESVVVHDAAEASQFSQDPYIKLRKPRSVLCMPLIHRARLTGLLYLENSITTGAFTTDRIEVLNLLCSQAAISIEHARLYGHLEELVDARTAELARTNTALHNEVMERKLAEDMLLKARDELEWRVNARTAELAQANASLHMEIAERKRTEEALQRAKDAAEAANRAKSAFLANMSHELRTPLNAILGFTQLLARDSRLLPQHQEHLQVVERSGEHLLALINDILEMSKIEAGLTVVHQQSFDLHRLLTDLVDMFHLRANNKGLLLCVDQKSEVPRYVCTDENKLRQVLINLLSNAIKFTEEGGITLRASRCTDMEHQTEDLTRHPASPDNTVYLHFEVEDTGPGIAPDDVPRLFEAFTQTDSGHQMQEGTGLGLPISQHFVRLLGGTIEVESEPGNGANFCFIIPTTLANAADVPLQRVVRRVVGLDPDQPTYRLLVVEDMWSNRKLMLNLLGSLGFDVREASNGEEGIAIWQTWQPHLIFMDIRMPVLDGYETTRRIKATPQGQQTPIVALTAGAFEEERAIVLSAGCDDFIRKPFRENAIFDVIQKYVGVQYVYENTDQTNTTELHTQDCYAGSTASGGWSALNSDALAHLSDEQLRTLHYAATLGDIDMLRRLIEQIGSNHTHLAAELHQLVEMFRFDQITNVTSAMLQETPEP